MLTEDWICLATSPLQGQEVEKLGVSERSVDCFIVRLDKIKWKEKPGAHKENNSWCLYRPLLTEVSVPSYCLWTNRGNELSGQSPKRLLEFVFCPKALRYMHGEGISK